MDAVNVELKDDTATYHSETFEEAKEAKARIIHWIPAENTVPVEIVMPDATIMKGLAENGVNNLEIGDIIQFERFGFARLDNKEDDKLTFYFAHK